jgi:hypothetical protein
VWCETEAAFVSAWDTSEPTVCPNDAGHTIVASRTAVTEKRLAVSIALDPVMEPVVPGSSKVIANDRPAIEILDGVTGFAAIQAIWPHVQNAKGEMKVTVNFILKAGGTGSNVRIAAQYKRQAVGDDSSGPFDESAFVIAPITYTTIGEVFSVSLVLPADVAIQNDSIALQFGRDGSNSMGAGTNDDVDAAIQVINVKAEAC